MKFHVSRPRNICYVDVPDPSGDLIKLSEQFGTRFFLVKEEESEVLANNSVYLLDCGNKVITYRKTRYECDLEGHHCTKEEYFRMVNAGINTFDDDIEFHSERYCHKHSGHKYLGLSVEKFWAILNFEH
jgi:hypothetical protein